jgi:hypothetical protein
LQTEQTSKLNDKGEDEEEFETGKKYRRNNKHKALNMK